MDARFRLTSPTALHSIAGMSTTDTLDSSTDAQLNELFAVEVAGLQPFKGDLPEYLRTGKHYTTDANAVLPWLDSVTEKTWESARGPGGFRVTLNLREKHGFSLGTGRIIDCFAPTFPRAAVIALIRAKRASR